MALIGERTSKIYRIGDEVRVRVARVNMDEHTIDFELVEWLGAAGCARRSFMRRRKGAKAAGAGEVTAVVASAMAEAVGIIVMAVAVMTVAMVTMVKAAWTSGDSVAAAARQS